MTNQLEGRNPRGEHMQLRGQSWTPLKIFIFGKNDMYGGYLHKCKSGRGGSRGDRGGLRSGGGPANDDQECPGRPTVTTGN